MSENGDFSSTRLDNFYLARTINGLANYFQLTTTSNVSETIALQQVTGLTSRLPNNSLRPPEAARQIIDLLINTSEGALTIRDVPTNSLLQRMSRWLRGSDRQSLEETPAISNSSTQRSTAERTTTLQSLQNFCQIYYANASSQPPVELTGIAFPVIGAMLNRSYDGNSANSWGKCSLINIKSAQISPANKYTEAISLYMNSIPQIEMSRAVPYVDVKFQLGVDPILGNKLNALSIFKFLEGAVNVAQNSPLSLLANVNSVPGSTNGSTNSSGFSSQAGIELFTTTQTMVNANESGINSRSLRGVPVLDPFRPFLTFKNLTIDVQPTVGWFSFKTGKMEFCLHDRSRLNEIATFIKPDLYGTTDLYLEYGWKHPDNPTENNPFADLLNASRVREKYMIRNVTIGFDEQGQANITLDIAMRGGTDVSSQTIGEANPSTVAALQHIRELSESISRYRTSLFRGIETAQIHGIQILDAAGDAQNNIRLTPEQVDQFRQFTRYLGNIHANPSANAITRTLQNLFGSATGRNNTNSGENNNVVTTIRSQIHDLLQRLVATPQSGQTLANTDPFLAKISDFRIHGSGNGREIALLSTGRGTTGHGGGLSRGRTTRNNGSNSATTPEIIPTSMHFSGAQKFVSLAKLLLYFVALPLAEKEAFTEVQLIFYPFNDCAGMANNMSIGSFPIDINYFFEQYVRLRTENASRAANITVRDFMAFIGATMLDDLAAPAYGLADLYTISTDRNSHIQTVAPTETNAAQFQQTIETRLRSQTPNGEFKMPQVQCFIEALPMRTSDDATSDRTTSRTPNIPDATKTILRLHVFDRQSSPYRAQGALIAATRNQVLNSLAPMPQDAQVADPDIHHNNTQLYQAIISAAETVPNGNGGIGLIRQIPGIDPAHPVYELNGGPTAIKEFVMSTMPYIIYGCQGTAIKSAQLSSQNVPELSTVNMLRSFRSGPLQPNGEQPGGLPLSIIPMELNMACLGCNLFEHTQQFFIDFQTGTSADNIYAVNGLSHKFEPGMFTTDVKFVYQDAYGKYSSFIDRINQAVAHLNQAETTNPNATPATPPTNHRHRQRNHHTGRSTPAATIATIPASRR